MSAPSQQRNHLPQSVIDYINLVVEKMGYRRKIRREVRTELMDHFTDALRDCDNSEERENLARELVADFGDAKILARLIRRGKKRCRPLWKKVIIRSLQAAGVFVALFVLYMVWFIEGEPTISIDYLDIWNRQIAPQLSAEDNAWNNYSQAIDLYAEPDMEVRRILDRSRYLERLRYPLHQLDRDDQQRLENWRRENLDISNEMEPEIQETIYRCLFEDNVPWTPDKDYRQWRYANFYEVLEKIKDLLRQQRPLSGLFEDGSLFRYEYNGQRLDEYKKLTNWIWSDQDQHKMNIYKTVLLFAVIDEWRRRSDCAPRDTFVELTTDEIILMKQWLVRNEQAWQQCMVASRKPYCLRRYETEDKQDTPLWSVLLPDLKPLRGLAQVGAWHAQQKMAEGQIETALEDCLALVRMGSHWRNPQLTLIDQLVGIHIASLGYDQMLRIMAQGAPSARLLQQTGARLEHIFEGDYPSIGMEGEKLMFMDAIQRVFTYGGLGGGHLIPKNLVSFYDLEHPVLLVGGSLIHARRDATISRANELYDYFDRLKVMTPYEKHVNNVNGSHDFLESVPKYRYWLIHMFCPALDSLTEISHRAHALHQASLTVLALQRWRLDHNKYPQTLQQLREAGFLTRLPDDPYSATILRYELRGDDFILYSLGADFDDDGGMQSPHDKWGQDEAGDDRVFWPVE